MEKNRIRNPEPRITIPDPQHWFKWLNASLHCSSLISNMMGFLHNVPYQTINSTVANGLMVAECGSTRLSQEQSCGSGSAGIRIDLALLDPDPYWECGSGSGKEAGQINK